MVMVVACTVMVSMVMRMRVTVMVSMVIMVP